MIIRKLGKLYIHKIEKGENEKESKLKDDDCKKIDNKAKDKKGEET
jgi:hypothetical protein